MGGASSISILSSSNIPSNMPERIDKATSMAAAGSFFDEEEFGSQADSEGLVSKAFLLGWTLRFSGLPSSISEAEIRESLSSYGRVCHIHHLNNGSESFVIFSRKSGADNAATFDFNTLPSVQATMERREEIRTEQANQGHCIAFPQVDHLGRSEPSWEGPVHYDSDSDGLYWENLNKFVALISEIIRDVQGLIEEFISLKNENAYQSKVSSFLLRVSGAIPEELIINAHALATWKSTMALFATERLSQHVDRFADTSINELLGCLDTSGALSDAWAETE
jgi:hypothetical protein